MNQHPRQPAGQDPKPTLYGTAPAQPDREAIEREWERARARREEREALQRAKRKKQRMWLLCGLGAVVLLAAVGTGIGFLCQHWELRPRQEEPLPSWIDPQILDLDGDARDGAPLEKVRDIAIHYVGNPGTTAMQNRNYFNLPGVAVSSHFIVGLGGEIVQCVPLDEKSAATNERNKDTISVEVCHPDETGKFTDTTYQALVKLTAWLCWRYDLDETHLIRHYDVTGKKCPLYYVEHEEAWEQFKTDVGAALDAEIYK